MLLRGDSSQVLGYYSLPAGQVSTSNLPPSVAKKLPKYPDPTAVPGRLVVDESVQGQRLGERLLVDAIPRVLAAAESVGMFAVIVDAIDDRAADFYARYGFERFPVMRSRLFLPLAAYRKRERK